MPINEQVNARQKLLVAVVLVIALLTTWLRPLDAIAERSVESGLKQALVAFGVARTLNAVISTLQEASVSLQIGAGVSVKPGAALDPLDDVVEQFSNFLFGRLMAVFADLKRFGKSNRLRFLCSVPLF